MLKKKLSIIVFIMIVVIALTLPIAKADDETAQTGEAVTISEDGNTENAETTETELVTEDNFKKSDVFLTGEDVTVDYIVDGNLFIMANNVTINSQIGGDAFILADTVTVGEQGYVFSNLFTTAKNVEIKGVVYDVYACTENMKISGYIYRDLRTIGGTLNIAGIIGRNAYVKMDNINFAEGNSEDGTTVTTNGRIVGDLNYTSNKELENIPEGAIGGEAKFNKENSEQANVQEYIMSLGKYVVSVAIIWLLCLWLAPNLLKNTDEILKKRKLAVVGYGILSPIVLILATSICLVVEITRNIGLITLSSALVFTIISSAIFVIAISNLISKKLKTDKKLITLATIIVTSIVIWLLGLIPILGTIVIYIASILGMGIVVTNLIPKRNKKEKEVVIEVKKEEKDNEDKNGKEDKKVEKEKKDNKKKKEKKADKKVDKKEDKKENNK